MFGKAIREARNARGLSQKGLSEKVGCTKTTVCDWENEKYPPTNANNIAALETALNFESGELYRLIYGNPTAPAPE